MGLHDLKRVLGLAHSILRKRPFSLLIQVTNRCNMRCSFCEFWSNGARPEKELTLEDFTRLEAELAAVGPFVISIEGGEPFVRKDIVEIVRLLSRRHVTVLYTNGWYITPDNARQLFEAGLTQVGVSIDFPDAADHDAKRCLEGTTERAWRAVDLLRDAAPAGGRQVHVMSILMEETRPGLPRMLEMSAEHGVGHYITLLATKGTRRGEGGSWPEGGVSEELVGLWKAHPHFRVFRDYLTLMDDFLGQTGAMPTCRAGTQSFNIDHLGNVAACIEKIGEPVGNVREAPLAELLPRLRQVEGIGTCQDCWTLCRGINQLLGDGGNMTSWWDFSTRMRSR